MPPLNFFLNYSNVFLFDNHFTTDTTTEVPTTEPQDNHTVSEEVTQYLSSNGVTASSTSTTTPRTESSTWAAIVTTTLEVIQQTTDEAEETTSVDSTSTISVDGVTMHNGTGKHKPDPNQGATGDN